jgi:glycosyltransferase involved in cell wall biosynthesis
VSVERTHIEAIASCRKTIPLSVVIIAKNEAANICRCLNSVAKCDEIVIIDDHSVDGTPQKAASRGARVLSHGFETFARQRNWAMDNAQLKHDWVLHLDADEAMTPSALDEIAVALRDLPSSAAAFLLCRRNWFLNRFLRHADGFPVWIMRLVRCGRARFVDSGHGEVPMPRVDGTVAKIHEPFEHYPFSRGMSDWLTRHNMYSTKEAMLEFRAEAGWAWRELFSRDTAARRRSLRNLARQLPMRSLMRFCFHYFFKLGMLDGRAGFVYSQLMAGYERMIVLKRWELALLKDSERSAPSNGSQIKPSHSDISERFSDRKP